MTKSQVDRINRIMQYWRKFQYPLVYDGDIRFLLTMIIGQDPDGEFEFDPLPKPYTEEDLKILAELEAETRHFPK